MDDCVKGEYVAGTRRVHGTPTGYYACKAGANGAAGAACRQAVKEYQLAYQKRQRALLRELKAKMKETEAA